MIFPVLNTMKAREADAIAMRNQVVNMQNEIKKNR